MVSGPNGGALRFRPTCPVERLRPVTPIRHLPPHLSRISRNCPGRNSQSLGDLSLGHSLPKLFAQLGKPGLLQLLRPAAQFTPGPDLSLVVTLRPCGPTPSAHLINGNWLFAHAPQPST